MMESTKHANHKVVVLDMQPIDPPVGGGRIRLLGLYHALGKNLPTTYVGTYDWMGEKYRQHFLSETLEEIDIPLSDEHFAECRQWEDRVGGKTIIDSCFHQLAHLSPQYVNRAIAEATNADIVIFSHPWIFPLVKNHLRDDQLIIYDSHNVEGVLRSQLLDDYNGFGAEVVKEVVKIEYDLCHRADIIFACSDEDRKLFHSLYDIHFEKINIVPNGVFTSRITPSGIEGKRKAKKDLGFNDQPLAIFLASLYPPNIEAAEFICSALAPTMPGVVFAICGGVGDHFNESLLHEKGICNIRITGFLEEQKKLDYLAAADIAINPMFSGSGTNIKMFDYMAAGIPIISTPTGARGIEIQTHPTIVISEPEYIVQSISLINGDQEYAKQLSTNAFSLVKSKYSWEKISADLGILLHERMSKRQNLDQPSQSSGNSVNSIRFFNERQRYIMNDGDDGKVKNNNNHRLGILTTWNIQCGIAEYSRYLTKELTRKDVECIIFANIERPKNVNPSTQREGKGIRVSDVWQMWRIEPNTVIAACRAYSLSDLNIQYHQGFFNQDLLCEIARKCKNNGINVIVTLHNSKDMETSYLHILHNAGAKLIVHSQEEQSRLAGLGIGNICWVPMGVLDVPDEDPAIAKSRRGISGYPVIGSVGFLRPYKGILELIEAVSILRDKFPDIVILGFNSLYPSEDSQNYFSLCKNRINMLGLDKHIFLETAFLEIDQIIRDLHACDVIVLPYHPSNEGSSAAAITAIASKRPLIISRSEIFKEIAGLCYQIENNRPETIVTALKSIILNTAILDRLKNNSISYVNANAWATVSEKYLKYIFQIKSSLY